jgi:hypothetical protein
MGQEMIKSFLSRKATATVGLFLALGGSAIADPAMERGLYAQNEPLVRDEYEENLANLKAAAIAKGKGWNDKATDGVKVLTYFKAVAYAVCGVESIKSAQNQGSGLLHDEVKFNECVKGDNEAISKFMSLMEYAPVNGAEDVARCQAKSRQYDREMNLLPYEFLRITSGSHHAYDFQELNRCLMSKL